MSQDTENATVRAEGFALRDMASALQEAGDDFIRLLRVLDPSEAALPVPGMTWTVSQTAAHMLTIVRRGLGDRRRADTVEGLAELNDLSLAEVPDTDPADLADLIAADMETYVTLLRATPEEVAASRIIRLHAGVRADVATALSYQLFDFIGHGFDIARATGRPWSIRPDHAVLVLRAGLPALGPWVRAEVLAGTPRSFTLTFPGFDEALVATTGDGRYHVRLGERDAADGEIDPVETFLAIAGRVEPSDPVVADLASWFRPI